MSPNPRRLHDNLRGAVSDADYEAYIRKVLQNFPMKSEVSDFSYDFPLDKGSSQKFHGHATDIHVKDVLGRQMTSIIGNAAAKVRDKHRAIYEPPNWDAERIAKYSQLKLSTFAELFPVEEARQKIQEVLFEIKELYTNSDSQARRIIEFALYGITIKPTESSMMIRVMDSIDVSMTGQSGPCYMGHIAHVVTLWL